MGARIREVREAMRRRLSQTELGLAVDISQSKLSIIEKYSQPVSEAEAERIAVALGVEVDVLRESVGAPIRWLSDRQTAEGATTPGLPPIAEQIAATAAVLPEAEQRTLLVLAEHFATQQAGLRQDRRPPRLTDREAPPRVQASPVASTGLTAEDERVMREAEGELAREAEREREGKQPPAPRQAPRRRRVGEDAT